LGQCCNAVGEYREAVRAYDIAATHNPEFYGTYFNRGLVKVRLRDAAGAEADFDRAIAARPDWADAHLNRAVARERGKRYALALDDLARALELGFTPTQVYLVRVRVYEGMGDKGRAAEELSRAMKTEPADERGWLARALADDLPGALADYAQALKLNPDSRAALQGTAGVLSRLGRTRESEEALTRLIGVTPD